MSLQDVMMISKSYPLIHKHYWMCFFTECAVETLTLQTLAVVTMCFAFVSYK